MDGDGAALRTEHELHGPVLVQRLGDEAGDAAPQCRLRQPLEQQRGNPLAVVPIADGKGHLCLRGSGATVHLADTDQLTVQVGQHGEVLGQVARHPSVQSVHGIRRRTVKNRRWEDSLLNVA